MVPFDQHRVKQPDPEQSRSSLQHARTHTHTNMHTHLATAILGERCVCTNFHLTALGEGRPAASHTPHRLSTTNPPKLARLHLAGGIREQQGRWSSQPQCPMPRRGAMPHRQGRENWTRLFPLRLGGTRDPAPPGPGWGEAASGNRGLAHSRKTGTHRDSLHFTASREAPSIFSAGAAEAAGGAEVSRSLSGPGRRVRGPPATFYQKQPRGEGVLVAFPTAARPRVEGRAHPRADRSLAGRRREGQERPCPVRPRSPPGPLPLRAREAAPTCSYQSRFEQVHSGHQAGLLPLILGVPAPPPPPPLAGPCLGGAGGALSRAVGTSLPLARAVGVAPPGCEGSVCEP